MKKLITHPLAGSNIRWIFALLIAVTTSSVILKLPDNFHPVESDEVSTKQFHRVKLIASLTQNDTTIPLNPPLIRGNDTSKYSPSPPQVEKGLRGEVDSLKNALNNAKHDTTKARLLIELTEVLYISDPDTIIILCKQALEVIDKNIVASNKDESASFLKTKATALNNIGYIHNVQGNPDKALEYYLQSQEIQKEINDKHGIANSLNNIGLIYHNQGNPDKALEYYLQSLEIQKEINDKQGIAYSLNNIGLIYYNQGNPDKALEYYLQSLEIQKEINNKRGIAISLNNIGVIYRKQGDSDRALEYYLQSLEIQKEINDKHGIANSFRNIGVIYHNQGDSDKALEYYLQSLEISKEINDKHGIAYSLNFIGELFFQLKDYAAATDYCTRSLRVAEELGYPENIMRAAGSLHKIYKAIAQRARKRSIWEYGEHYAKALEYNELYTQMRDTVHNNDMSKAIGKTEGKFEFKMALKEREQREKEQARLQAAQTAHRNNLQYVAIAMGLFVFVTIIVFLGNLVLPEWLVNALSFVPFVLLFEFITELIEPFTEAFTGNQPVYEVLINAAVVLLIFPIQYFFEKKLRQRLYKAKKKRAVARIVELQ